MVFFHESAPEQEKCDARKISSPAKRQNCGILRGLGCFLGRKWAVAVPIFTQFNFFPLQTYFYAKSHLLSILKPKKSDRWRKKCDRSTPALNCNCVLGTAKVGYVLHGVISWWFSVAMIWQTSCPAWRCSGIRASLLWLRSASFLPDDSSTHRWPH